jgi:hypothetical protein
VQRLLSNLGVIDLGLLFLFRSLDSLFEFPQSSQELSEGSVVVDGILIHFLPSVDSHPLVSKQRQTSELIVVLSSFKRCVWRLASDGEVECFTELNQESEEEVEKHLDSA